MTRKTNITQVRKEFLTLPERLRPGEELLVYRHRKPVLRILKVDDRKPQLKPFAFLEQIRKSLPKPPADVPRDLSANLKEYLYGRKRKKSWPSPRGVL